MPETPTRAVRCRYLRRDGNQCQNEVAGQGDEEILLCFKHLQRAHKLFHELVESKLGDRAKQVLR